MLSYLALRKAVGLIGVALPFVLVIGDELVQHQWIQKSISAYYYTDMRNVFVASLCAIGIFLICTKGYDCKDQIAGIFAGLFAIGVAFLPTTPAGCTDTTRESDIGTIHFTCAALLFLTFAYFCLFLFTMTNTPNPTTQKLKRNVVYRVCGVLILLCIASVLVLKMMVAKDSCPQAPIFWSETVACWSFGVAWLVKGETILKDA